MIVSERRTPGERGRFLRSLAPVDDHTGALAGVRSACASRARQPAIMPGVEAEEMVLLERDEDAAAPFSHQLPGLVLDGHGAREFVATRQPGAAVRDGFDACRV